MSLFIAYARACRLSPERTDCSERLHRGRRSQICQHEPHRRKREQAMTEQHETILRLKAVLQRTGLSRSSLYRKMQAGSFPKGVQISERCVGWHASAVDHWVRNPKFYVATETG